jgi:hypothetical protein
MTRKHSLVILIFTTALCCVAAIVIYRDYFNEEGDVYLAYLSHSRNELHDVELANEFHSVAFLSAPSTCHDANNADMPDASQELFENFLSVNNDKEQPINLRALEGQFNVVSFREATQLHENKFSILFRTTNKRLIGLSRVGFDKNKTHALFCIEPNRAGYLVYLIKENGVWKLVKNSWVYAN